MIFPKLFNHGNLKSIKVDEGKLVMEGTYGKEEFEGGSGLPEGGYDGQVIMKDQGEAKWLWPLPPGDANTFLKKTSEGNTYAFRAINEVPGEGTAGQVLKKTSDGYGWGDAPSGGSIGNYVTLEGYYTNSIDTSLSSGSLNSQDFESLDIISVSGTPAAGTPVQLMVFIGDDAETQEIEHVYPSGVWREEANEILCNLDCVMQLKTSSSSYFYTLNIVLVYSSNTISLRSIKYDKIS